MDEGQDIGVDVGLESGLVHQAPHGMMSHHQAVELLGDVITQFVLAASFPDARQTTPLKPHFSRVAEQVSYYVDDLVRGLAGD